MIKNNHIIQEFSVFFWLINWIIKLMNEDKIRKVVDKVSKEMNKTYDDIIGKYDKLIKDIWINSEGNLIITPISNSQKKLYKTLYKQIRELNLIVDYNSKLKKLLIIKRRQFDFDKSENCQKKNKEIIEFISSLKEWQ